MSEFRQMVERDLWLVIETRARDELLAELQRHGDEFKETLAELEKNKEQLEERLRFQDLILA